MEPPVQTYVTNMEVASTELNAIQALIVSLRPADSINQYTSPLLPNGLTALEWMISVAALNDGVDSQVDASLDFRDRVLTVHYCTSGSNAERPGGANDYLFDYDVAIRKGYTGRGAFRSGGVLAPATGNPPVPAAGVSWAMQIATDVWLYAHPTDGALHIYNATGGDLFATQLTIFATAQTGVRP